MNNTICNSFGRLGYNPLLDNDSYKHGQSGVMPDDVTSLSSYIEARIDGDIAIPFGLQMALKRDYMVPVSAENAAEYIEVTQAHGDPTDYKMVDIIMKRYGGFMPVEVWGVPEGTPIETHEPMVVVESVDPELKGMAQYVETNLLRSVWYPTTIASNDLKSRRVLQRFYDNYSDSPDVMLYSMHDFGARGVSSEETAQIGGAAHMVFYRGTDNFSGLRAARHFYDMEILADGVIASEHTQQIAWGRDRQHQYIQRMLDLHAKPGKIVSIVADGYDLYGFVELLCTEFRDQIIASGAKIVVRPDSGDPCVTIPRILQRLDEAFGHIVNSKGMKVLKHVGIIQGDGVNCELMENVLNIVTQIGFAPENVVFGSGGNLLQSPMRDDMSFAQKASAMLVDGKWVPIKKDPITAPGKKSKAGRMITNKMVKFYEPGKLLVNDNMSVIRGRAMTALVA